MKNEVNKNPEIATPSSQNEVLDITKRDLTKEELEKEIMKRELKREIMSEMTGTIIKPLTQEEFDKQNAKETGRTRSFISLGSSILAAIITAICYIFIFAIVKDSNDVGAMIFIIILGWIPMLIAVIFATISFIANLIILISGKFKVGVIIGFLIAIASLAGNVFLFLSLTNSI